MRLRKERLALSLLTVTRNTQPWLIWHSLLAGPNTTILAVTHFLGVIQVRERMKDSKAVGTNRRLSREVTKKRKRPR